MSDNRIEDIELALTLDDETTAPAMLVHFSPEVLEAEIERRFLLKQAQKGSHQRSDTYRSYVPSEQQWLPVALQHYLWTLEKQGEITLLQREWVLESVIETAEASELYAVPESLFIATLFVIQGLDGVLNGDIPLTWRQQQDVSGREH